MAGDWIPHAKGLSRRPEVIRIASITGRSRQEIVGWLHELWEWADSETEDGRICPVFVRDLSAVIGADSALWDAVVSVGWLIERDGIEIPNFSRWLGRNAKRRLKDKERKGISRAAAENEAANGPDSVRKMSACEADENRTTGQDRTVQNRTRQKRRGQKRRNKKTPPIPPSCEGGLFERFWKEYPNKVGKKKAQDAWNKIAPSVELSEKISAAIAAQRTSARWTKDKGAFIPNPATWLNQGRWDDQPAEELKGKSIGERVMEMRRNGVGLFSGPTVEGACSPTTNTGNGRVTTPTPLALPQRPS